MPYYSVKFDKNSYPLERYYYNEDLSVKSIQEFYPGTDKIMKEEYNLDFKTSSVTIVSFMKTVQYRKKGI